MFDDKRWGYYMFLEDYKRWLEADLEDAALTEELKTI